MFLIVETKLLPIKLFFLECVLALFFVAIVATVFRAVEPVFVRFLGLDDNICEAFELSLVPNYCTLAWNELLLMLSVMRELSSLSAESSS